MSSCDPIRTHSSENRLEKLIRARLEPGADKPQIDARIWDLFGERWAVMFTDLSGFSRHVAEFGIVHFLQVIQESMRLLVPVIDDHDGFLLKSEGDSMLVIFRRPSRAVACAVTMQHVLERYNVNRIPSEKILLCVGLGYGDLLRIGDHEVFGAEVNAASKLGEDTAGPKEILTTAAIEETCRGDVPQTFAPIDTVPPGASGAFRLLYDAT